MEEPDNSRNMTATEVRMRQEEWAKKVDRAYGDVVVPYIRGLAKLLEKYEK
jgi:hypothetical protein